MPTPMQAAVASHENDILRVLVTYTNDAPRDRLVSTAATNTDWRQPTATADFLDKITAAVPSSALATHESPPSRAAQHDR